MISRISTWTVLAGVALALGFASTGVKAAGTAAPDETWAEPVLAAAVVQDDESLEKEVRERIEALIDQRMAELREEIDRVVAEAIADARRASGASRAPAIGMSRRGAPGSGGGAVRIQVEGREQLEKLLAEGGLPDEVAERLRAMLPEAPAGEAAGAASPRAGAPSGGGYLGVGIGSADGGVLVTDVYDGTAAAKAGLRTGDVIVSVDGTTIASTEDLIGAIGSKAPGTAIALRVARDGETTTYFAVLGERGDTAPSASAPVRERARARAAVPGPGPSRPAVAVEAAPSEARPWLGVTIQERDEGESGVDVVEVKPASPALAAGFEDGDVIVGMNGRPITSVDELAEAVGDLSVGTTVAFEVRREDGAATLRVTLVPEGTAVPTPRRVAPPAGGTAGSAAPGFLGVAFQSAPDGVEVTRVVSGAEAAGIRVGDTIVSINGQAVESLEALPGMIRSFRAGDTVQVRIRRDGETRDLMATLGTNPEAGVLEDVTEGIEIEEIEEEAEPAEEIVELPVEEADEAGGVDSDRAPGYLGVESQGIGEDVRRVLGLEEGVGVTLTRIVEGTPAERAGLKVWDVLVAINGESVGSTNELGERIRAAGAGSEVGLTVIRKGTEMELRATLGRR